jgi:glycerol uptake facilitator-like aquaporin
MFKFLFGFAPTKEVVRQVLTLMTAAFGLVAALAWNEAIQTLVNRYFSFTAGGQVVSKFVYALAITFILVLITVQLAKLRERFHLDDEEEQGKKK